MLIKKGGISRDIAPNSWGEYARKGYVQAGEALPALSESPPPPAKLACPHCDKEYATEATLNKHIAEKHPAATPMEV